MIATLKLPRLRWAFVLTLALAGNGEALAMGQPPGASSTAGITTITLERNCFGCTTGSVLQLHRDGRATYTVTGNARSGTTNKTSTGTVAADEFERLARLAVASDFFALKESYDDAQTRDGVWVTTTIARDGMDKQVFRREGAGPPSLGAIEAGIDAAGARIRFNP